MLRKLARKAIPSISETERVALNCGTVSLDGKIFNGTFSKEDVSVATLTEEEQYFLDNTVPAIIKTHYLMGLEQATELMKTEGMFGLNIPKEYGGMGFSPAANSAIMTALSSSGYQSLAVTAMVPNSLGPAELLMHHGTEEEKNKYLPRLANGMMIPCFALTGPNNGSDATNNMDQAKALAWYGEYNWEVELDKRYITLAPIADLIGLALDVEGFGITLFLIERDREGLDIGDRHDPMGLEFPNGPIRGKIHLTEKDILGGVDNLGRGWQMLVECLSVGRAVSLPAMGVGLSRMVMAGTGAYTNTRKQFNVPLWKFEAIQEKLADIKYHSTILEATQKVINGELNKGEQPAILGAMFKYQATERGRIIVNHAMDITGGVGIQEGPNNWLAESYRGIPIGITVEGANVMTRSLITYGQGLVRSHPHIQDIIDGAHGSAKQFYGGLYGILKHAVRTGARATTGDIVSLFAFTADLTLLLGGKLKRSEYISGRMADFFSNVFFLNIVDNEFVKQRLLWETKELFYEIYRELPLFARAKLWLPAKICFFKAKKPTFKDIRAFMQDYHEDAKTRDVKAPEGSRLWELMETLHGSEEYVDSIIQVDSHGERQQS